MHAVRNKLIVTIYSDSDYIIIYIYIYMQLDIAIATKPYYYLLSPTIITITMPCIIM